MSDDVYGGLPGQQPVATSLDAAISMLGHVAGLRERVLRYVAACGARGATVDEIEVALDMLHQTASARARELVLLDAVYVSTLRRKTRSGRYARVLLVGADPNAVGAVLARPPGVLTAQEALPW